MTTSIEQILSTPDKEKETKYSIITTMSKNYGRGLIEAKKTLMGGGKNLSEKELKKKFIINKQCTLAAEEREKKRTEKRK